jgi:hypothetical protein
MGLSFISCLVRRDTEKVARAADSHSKRLWAVELAVLWILFEATPYANVEH